MHELPVTENIINIANEEALKHGAKKINEIRIKIGELSGMVPECIQVYFDMLSAGTKAEGAKLIVSKIPIRFKCCDCSTESGVENGLYKCPNCGSRNIKIIQGREFLVDSMEVE